MAKAVHASTHSAFLTQLLAPIVAPTEPVQDRRYLRELRYELKQSWDLACHRYYAAKAYREHCAHMRIIAELEQRTVKVPEATTEHKAQLAMLAAVNRMMHIPAPTISALRLKAKLRSFSGGRQRWDAAIAADEARLL